MINGNCEAKRDFQFMKKIKARNFKSGNRCTTEISSFEGVREREIQRM